MAMFRMTQSTWLTPRSSNPSPSATSTSMTVSRLREAVSIQDTLKYGEPPDWFFPVRESLGGNLLASGKAEDAEKVFREDLDRNPRNPRSLFGLSAALKAQKKDYDAHFVDEQFRSSWKSVTNLKAEDLV